MDRRDAACTAYTPVDTSMNQGQVAWSYRPEASDHLVNSVILPDGTIVLVAGKRRVVALDPNGNEIWTWRSRSGFVGEIVIGTDGNVYAHTGYDLYCVSPQGETVWSASLPSQSELTPFRGSVYFSCGREL